MRAPSVDDYTALLRLFSACHRGLSETIELTTTLQGGTFQAYQQSVLMDLEEARRALAHAYRDIARCAGEDLDTEAMDKAMLQDPMRFNLFALELQRCLKLIEITRLERMTQEEEKV